MAKHAADAKLSKQLELPGEDLVALAGKEPVAAVDAPEGKFKHERGALIALVALLVVALCAVGAVAYYATAVKAAEEARLPDDAAAQAGESDSGLSADLDDDLDTAEEEAAYYEAHKGHPAVNPLIAMYEDIELRSPVDPADLTGVLFHQASYKYALVMQTELPDADMEEMEKTHDPRVNNEQMEGQWLDADAMHLWRVTDATEMDTSIDVGAKRGTVVRAPVTGTVVLVKDYMLYNEVPDIEIHIQPEGRPDLDVVIIHTTDPLVKAGDKVEAGVTEMSHVRDIAKDLTDIQLGYYTPSSDPGNHAHVQVNNADYEDYRKTKLEGAITI